MKRGARVQLTRRLERLEATIGGNERCVCGLAPELALRGYRTVGFAEVTPDGAVSVDDSDVGDILERDAVFGWGWTVKVDCHDCGLERRALPFRFN
jgi:hypothetical protein